MLVSELSITTLGFLYITPRMENDSLNVNGADSVAVDSAVATPEIQMPSAEQLGISIVAGPQGGMPAVTVGDTFEFPVPVSWRVQGSALLVVPTGSANVAGIGSFRQGRQGNRLDYVYLQDRCGRYGRPACACDALRDPDSHGPAARFA